MTVDPGCAEVRLQAFSSCSHAHSTVEASQVLSLVEALKDVLKEKAVELLQAFPALPVLFQFSLDCTPVVTRKVVSQSHGALKVKRSAKRSQEYLVQQLFLTTPNVSGGFVNALLFRDPHVLEFGKTMAALAACALECPGMSLKNTKSKRICIRHQVHDRGITRVLVGAVSGHWATNGKARTAGSETADDSGHSLREWHTHVGCCAHDGHNALKWSHQALFADTTLLENVYVGIQAIRSTYSFALDVLSSWISDRLLPRHVGLLPSEDDLFALWTCLGVDREVAQSLARFRLLWQEGRLMIHEDTLKEDSWLEAVSTSLLSVWRFRTFTNSRWCTVGASCRDLVAGLLTGYWNVVETM